MLKIGNLCMYDTPKLNQFGTGWDRSTIWIIKK